MTETFEKKPAEADKPAEAETKPKHPPRALRHSRKNATNGKTETMLGGGDSPC